MTERGNYADGVAQFRHLLRRQPDHVGAQLNLGQAYERWGQLEEAEAVYRQMLHRWPQMAQAAEALANCLRRQGRIDEALIEYERAAARSKDKRAVMLKARLALPVIPHSNEQIQEFVDAGLSACGVAREAAVFADTGDGAMLLFDDAATAHRFALAVHQACDAHNRHLSVASAQRWFRIGIATGEVAERTESGTHKVAGLVLSNAVRLETAGDPGHVLIDAATYDALPAELRDGYAGPEAVTGKRSETFQAYRYIVTAASPGPAAPTVMSVLDLFDALNPRDQLGRLMLLLEMPPQHRPSETLTLAQRQDRIVDWACGEQDGLHRLDDALRHLIERQSHPQ